MAVLAGVRAGICMIAVPRRMRCVQRADPGQRRHRVRAVGLCRPHRIIAQPVRRLDHLQRQFNSCARITGHQAQTHGGLLLVAQDAAKKVVARGRCNTAASHEKHIVARNWCNPTENAAHKGSQPPHSPLWTLSSGRPLVLLCTMHNHLHAHPPSTIALAARYGASSTMARSTHHPCSRLALGDLSMNQAIVTSHPCRQIPVARRRPTRSCPPFHAYHLDGAYDEMFTPNARRALPV